MAWVAFDRAVKAVEQFGLDGPVDRWRALRDDDPREVCREGFDAELGAFVQSYGSKRLDASLLMIPLVGFLPADDPRVVGTVAAIERELMRDGFVARYRADEENVGVDGLPPGEGAFLPCTFWLADNYALQGRRDEARGLFERLLATPQRRRPAVRGVRPRARPAGGQLPAGVLAHRPRRHGVTFSSESLAGDVEAAETEKRRARKRGLSPVTESCDAAEARPGWRSRLTRRASGPRVWSSVTRTFGSPADAFELAAGEQEWLAADEWPVPLVHRRRDDQVHLAGLVLEEHEDDPVGGRRPLAGDRHARHRDLAGRMVGSSAFATVPGGRCARRSSSGCLPTERLVVA